MTSFYLLLSVVPLYASERGIGAAGAGLSTGVLMVTAVAAELATPALAARVGFGRLLAAGLVLLGRAGAGAARVGGLPGLLAVCGYAGAGSRSSWSRSARWPRTRDPGAAPRRGARRVRPRRDGAGCRRAAARGLARRGGRLPAVFAIAAGLGRCAGRAAGAGPLAPMSSRGRGSGLGLPACRPAVVFFATAVAGGVVVAFLPGAVPPRRGRAGAARPGRDGDADPLAGRPVRGPARWRAACSSPAVVLAAAGMATAAATGSGPAVLAGMALFGTGFGLAQAASLTTMLRGPPGPVRRGQRGLERRVRPGLGCRSHRRRRAGRRGGLRTGVHRHRRGRGAGRDEAAHSRVNSTLRAPRRRS